VTATPHSGNEEAFRSLLSLLDPEFASLPVDLEGREREGARRKLAQRLVQRRRADIRHFLDKDTAFPTRKDKEATYTFSKEYRALFDDILGFARDYVSEDGSEKRHQRVRYWSALALLRCVSSSPAAAAATLRSRAAVDETEGENIDEVGRRTVLDQGDDDDSITLDLSPGSRTEAGADATRRKLLEFARRAEAIGKDSDNKLKGAIKEIKGLLRDDFRPVVFCRFIDTAEYVARQLREALPNSVKVESVTGALPPSERENRIAKLAENDGKYVLVCTDCLSEGINLQETFTAVLHYDMAWNPTRHEQREGRVDRFGQKRSEVRVVTYYGENNPIDGVILEVLIKKHKAIKSALGVTIAVPGSSEKIVEALFEAALFKEQTHGVTQLSLDFVDTMKKDELHQEWENARDKEKASRSRFAQHALDPEVVAEELRNVQEAVGLSGDVSRFFIESLKAANVPFDGDEEAIEVKLTPETPRAMRQALGRDDPFKGRFELPLKGHEIYLGRTSPVIEGLAGWTLDQALDPAAREGRPIASRCGAAFTSAVQARTTLLVVRFRYHMKTGGRQAETILCEEIVPLACTGSADDPLWISAAESEHLLTAQPERNLVQTGMEQQMGLLVPALPKFQAALGEVAKERAKGQLAAHERVREAARTRGKVTIEPVLPVDLLGAYVLLPMPGTGGAR
jgi:hypothetical protein